MGDDLLADLRAGYVHTITMTDLTYVDRAKMQEKRRMTSETQSLLVPPEKKPGKAHKKKRRKTAPPSPQTSDDEDAASPKRRKTKHGKSKSDPESRKIKTAKSLPSISALEEPPSKRQHKTAEPSESPLVPKEEHDNQDPA